MFAKNQHTKLPLNLALMVHTVIRGINNSDIDNVFFIMKRNMSPYYEARGESWNEDSIRRYFLNMESAVLEEQGQVCAFTFFESTPKGAHIHTLQVAPERQNGVLGAKLFRWYLELASPNDSFELTCNVYITNPALNMYLKLGFAEVGREAGVVNLCLPLTNGFSPFLPTASTRRRERRG